MCGKTGLDEYPPVAADCINIAEMIRDASVPCVNTTQVHIDAMVRRLTE